MHKVTCEHCGRAFGALLVPRKDSPLPSIERTCSQACKDALAKASVVALVPLGNLGNTAAVAILEEWLERARSGELVALALIAQTADRCTATQYAIGEGDIAVLNLALDRMKQRLLDEDGT